MIDGVDGAGEVDLTGVSLRVEGAWAEANSDTWTAFTAESASAFGALHTLAELSPSGGGARLNVQVTRAPARLFDGLDFREADERDITSAVLRNVIEDSVVEVTLSAAK